MITEERIKAEIKELETKRDLLAQAANLQFAEISGRIAALYELLEKEKTGEDVDAEKSKN